MVTKIRRSQFKDFNEEVEDAVGPSISGVGVISVTYDDNNDLILISGSLTDYYTQNETDALLTTISGDIIAQMTASGITYAQLISTSGVLSDALTTHKSSSDHDSRYYTEAEVDTISGVIVAQISSVSSSGVVLLSTPSNNNFSGITTSGTTSAAFSQAVYLNSASVWALARADSALTMPVAALATGNSNEVFTYGFITNTTWDWTPGGLIYVSDSISGALTQVASTSSGSQIQFVGIATGADTMFFNPDFVFMGLGDPPFYTKSEITTISGDITNKIPTESLYYKYRGSLDYLVSSVGSAEKIIAVDCNNVVEGNISIPSNIQLFYIDGCITTVSSGITLTIYSPNNVLAKQTQQIFAGIGLSPTHFSNPGTVYPEWWGIDGVGDEIQFQKAYDSLINGGKVLINGLNYSVNLYSAVSSNTQTEISPWTTITLASGCHCQVFYVYECDNVRFYGGGTVDGNRNNQSGVDYTMNFGLHSSSNIKIDGLKIKSGLCRGLYVTECENVVIRDCEILDCGRNGIMTYQSSHIKILDNYFHDNGDTGEGHLFIYSGTIDIIVKGNTFGVTGQLIGQSHGIYVMGTAGCIIADNGFYDIYGFGIEAQPSVSGTGIIINGNHFHNCGNAPSETGSLFMGCPRTIVSNNFIGESVEHGIFEFNGSDSIISSNIVINTSGVLSVGIREMNDTSNTIVLGNLVIDDQPVPTQKYGIIIENESAVVIGNNVLGNVHSYLEMNDAAQQSKMGNLELYNDPIPAGGALVFSDSQRRSTYKAVLTDNLHVSKTYFHTLFLTASGANRGVYCDGVYEAGNEFWVKNVGNFYSIEFDASGISLYIPASGVAYFIYDGFSWVNMYKSF